MAHTVEQLYTNCLAEAAYYIESNGEAAIIDPLREVEPYLELLHRRGARLRYVIETHFHADFVSGHLDLARQTGASIVYGPGAQASAQYTIHEARDGERLPLGDITLEVIHTPGHTLESSCFLLRTAAGEVESIFTGDTLFVGDVGRPDLAVKSDLTREQLASLLYDSIERLKQLPDHVVVYPGHGAGSACGKQIGKETTSTIGLQKQLNYALQPMTREQFIEAVTEGQTVPPRYFFQDAGINKRGYDPIDAVLTRNLKPLTPAQLEAEVAAGALVLDTRAAEAFAAGYVPGAVNVGLGGQYAIWVGTLFDVNQPIVLVSEPTYERESVMRLARVGFENVRGYLEGGMAAWKGAGRPVETVENVAPADFAGRMAQARVLDVRNESERISNGVVPGSLGIPVGELIDRMGELDAEQPVLVHCAGGYRSMIAASLLRRAGYRQVANVSGGVAAMKAAGAPVAQLALA